MNPINKPYKRAILAILIGAICGEAVHAKTGSDDPSLLWAFAIPSYIVLSLIYNRYLWKKAQVVDEDENEEY